MTALRLATRRSALALAQAETVAAAIRDRSGVEVELVPVVSEGDRSTAPLREIGGVGVFVTAVREALLSGAADVAVHSLKDLPTAADDSLRLAAVPPRADVRDAVVARTGTLGDLPPGATVGTGSARRAAQLRQLRPDLVVVDIRGNVDTRIGLVDSDQVSAVILAMAGLERLRRTDRVSEILPADVMMPAPGQGALAVETRADDTAAIAAVLPLDDAPTRTAVTAERGLLQHLEAGCTAPVGALATVVGPQIFLKGVAYGTDGTAFRVSVAGPTTAALELGRAAAEKVLAEGAGRLEQGAVR